MGVYFRTVPMSEGKPFRCHNCNRFLISHISGQYTLELYCPKCKARIFVKTREPIPDWLEYNIDVNECRRILHAIDSKTRKKILKEFLD